MERSSKSKRDKERKSSIPKQTAEKRTWTGTGEYQREPPIKKMRELEKTRKEFDMENPGRRKTKV